ncbi:hypothetical protein P4S63_11355 [Pseudoalteromonas sp. B193]
MPVLDSVTMNAAVRLSDYSTVGNTESWNVGIDWEVMDSYVYVLPVHVQHVLQISMNYFLHLHKLSQVV